MIFLTLPKTSKVDSRIPGLLLALRNINTPHPCPSPLEGEGKRERGLYRRRAITHKEVTTVPIYESIFIINANLSDEETAAVQFGGGDK